MVVSNRHHGSQQLKSPPWPTRGIGLVVLKDEVVVIHLRKDEHLHHALPHWPPGATRGAFGKGKRHLKHVLARVVQVPPRQRALAAPRRRQPKALSSTKKAGAQVAVTMEQPCARAAR